MKPIDVDELFRRNDLKNEMDSTLNVNETTYELFVTENITEKYSETNNRLDEESIINLQDITKKPDKVNYKIKELVDNEKITKESRENP